jgi:hypothetical protein
MHNTSVATKEKNMGKQRIEVYVSFEMDIDDAAENAHQDDELVAQNEQRVREAFDTACDAVGADGVGTTITTTSLVINGVTWDL